MTRAVLAAVLGTLALAAALAAACAANPGGLVLLSMLLALCAGGAAEADERERAMGWWTDGE